MNKNILVPIELAIYLGYDNEDDYTIDILGETYKEIYLYLFIEDGLGIPDTIKTNVDNLYI